LAEVQSAIKKPKAKMERIAFAPLPTPSQRSCAHNRPQTQAAAASRSIKLAGSLDESIAHRVIMHTDARGAGDYGDEPRSTI
jgi:hypothetical protein